MFEANTLHTGYKKKPHKSTLKFKNMLNSKENFHVPRFNAAVVNGLTCFKRFSHLFTTTNVSTLNSQTKQ